MGKKSRKHKVKTAAASVLPTDDILQLRLLELCLAQAKKDFSNLTNQVDLVDTITSPLSPDVYLHSNYKSEVPITILVGLEKHGDEDMAYKTKACQALCTLIRTPCYDTVLRLWRLKEFMEKNLECEPIQELIFDTFRQCVYRPYFDMFSRANFHEVVVRAMKHHAWPATNNKIFIGGGCFLTHLVEFCSDEDRKDRILINIVGSLIAAVDRSDEDPFLAHRCCTILGTILNTAKQFETRYTIPFYANGGVSKVITMMKRHPENARIQQSGCWFLSLFADKEYQQIECFHAVMEALKSCYDDSGARYRGMYCIRKIVFSQTGYGLVIKSEHTPFLLELMKQHREELEVQVVGCSILALMTYRVEVNEPVTNQEAAHLLANALKLTPPEEEAKILWLACFGALSKMFMYGDNETLLVTLLKEDCFSDVATVLKYAKDKNVNDQYAFRILREMAASKRNDVKLAVATSGCTDVIIDYMKSNPGNKQIQEWGSHALGLVTINKDPRIFEAISKADGVNIILDAIDRFPKEEIIFNFGGSAAILTREYEDDKKYGKLEF